MNFLKKFLKWSALGGLVGGAYGFGVTSTTKKVSKKRRFRKGRK